MWDVLFQKWRWTARLGEAFEHGWCDTEAEAERTARTVFDSREWRLRRLTRD